MIVLDADVILIDRKFTRNVRHPTNRSVLDRLQADGHIVAMVAHTILEVVGIMSFGTAAADVPLIPGALRTAYGIVILPDPASEPEYGRCSFDELLVQMSMKMSLGDAIQAVQIVRFVPHASALLTWNAKHFQGRLAIPVLTPEEWLLQQPPAATTP